MKDIKKLVLTLIVISIIILSVFSFIFIDYFYKNDECEEEEEEIISHIIDDISPNTNQGIFLEMNRIRHRGLLEKMMQYGTSWKTKPSFYYKIDIDGLEVKSNEIEAPGGSSETLFNDWDTIFQESRITKDIDEEQETSKITITIIERVKKGILGLRTTDVERDELSIIYDYRTGRWSGDDYNHK